MEIESKQNSNSSAPEVTRAERRKYMFLIELLKVQKDWDMWWDIRILQDGKEEIETTIYKLAENKELLWKEVIEFGDEYGIFQYAWAYVRDAKYLPEQGRLDNPMSVYIPEYINAHSKFLCASTCSVRNRFGVTMQSCLGMAAQNSSVSAVFGDTFITASILPPWEDVLSDEEDMRQRFLSAIGFWEEFGENWVNYPYGTKEDPYTHFHDRKDYIEVVSGYLDEITPDTTEETLRELAEECKQEIKKFL